MRVRRQAQDRALSAVERACAVSSPSKNGPEQPYPVAGGRPGQSPRDNSVGQVIAQGHRYLVAVLSNGSASMSEGMSLVERTARQAVS
ncbi:hypothetical protein AV521_40295 [Streptomyces sp. IMTB 2501]|nr:hypothetical protein AV521_40295 [Streptomyces sp. IMTB 2501]